MLCPAARFLLVIWALLCAITNAASSTKAPPTYIIHIVADDLGYNDVAWHNNQTKTPALDALVKEGVELMDFYVYKMCAPSRASILSGRYPMHLGMYNNNGLQEGVQLNYTLLPELLKADPKQNWSTHALGKWHLGWHSKAYLPTSRGFDTFLGSSGNTKDYWNHTIGGPSYECGGTKVWRDFINCTGPCTEASLVNPSAFGQYDTHVLGGRAIDIVRQHDTSRSLYIYLAFHNVHEPQQAPLETVEKFPLIPFDMRKVTDASLLELDYIVGNLTALLVTRGMEERSVLFFHTDNGGPTSHACNAPYRGGKFTFWEGGVRGVSFVRSGLGSGLIPSHRRGSRYSGLAHISDLYRTFAEGIANITIATDTGPVPPDSFNLWPSLVSGASSPRPEVVHLPLSNQYVNTSVDKDGKPCPVTGGNGCSPSIRVGDLKLVIGWPGGDGLCHLSPPLAPPGVTYGKSGGKVTPNTDQCDGGKWDYKQKATHQNSTCIPHCLFDLRRDPSESNDLSSDPKHTDDLHRLYTRLSAVSATGVAIPELMPKKEYRELYYPIICGVANKTGFWLPFDWLGASPPPTPSPPSPNPSPPSPSPNECSDAIAKTCPASTYPSFHTCRECCHDHVDTLKGYGCRPKIYNAVCEKRNTTQ